jgi:tRNA pseudouridine65 synthase
MSLPILYRDPFVVIVDKPAGLFVHRTALDRHAEDFAVQRVRNAIGARVWPVHRLDRGTSGVLVLATSREIAGRLGRGFESRAVEKRYVALVRGWPAADGGIDHPLTARDDFQKASPAARPARGAHTAFTRLARIELPHRVDRYPTSRYALLALSPSTGRRHQLRRHLKHVAHPIIGDATYGKGRHNRLIAQLTSTTRLWLHALAIGFTHPSSGARVDVTAPLDDAWERLLALPGWMWDAQGNDQAGAASAGSKSSSTLALFGSMKNSCQVP